MNSEPEKPAGQAGGLPFARPITYSRSGRAVTSSAELFNCIVNAVVSLHPTPTIQ